MARRHILASTGLLLMSAFGPSCSSSPPRDMWFGTDAGAGFEAPVVETGTDSADTADASEDTTSDTTADSSDDTGNPDASTD